MRYTVRHNFRRSQPQWRGDYVRIFGERNEGFTVEAESLAEAKQIVEGAALRPSEAGVKQHDGQPLRRGLNPFYLSFTDTYGRMDDACALGEQQEQQR